MGMIYLDDAIEAIASRDETDGIYNVFSGKQVIDILKGLPSAEPESDGNGSVSADTHEKMHDRTMGDLISRQRAIEAIDKFIPADPMMSDYTQGISVGLAIATRCIEEFSQENDDSSQGLVKQQTKRQATIPSDCISRQDAIKSMANAIWHYPNELYTGLNSYEMSEALAKDGLMFLPSAEPKTPSNGSITSMNTEKMHVRTMGDLISREEAIDAILSLTNCDTVEGLRVYVIEHDLGSWWSGGVLSSIGKVERLPSAEKAQLSEEDATSVCKCPCEYREPCDVCHYDACRKHGCPAEEGLKNE